jgi:hypothetical protein
MRVRRGSCRCLCVRPASPICWSVAFARISLLDPVVTYSQPTLHFFDEIFGHALNLVLPWRQIRDFISRLTKNLDPPRPHGNRLHKANRCYRAGSQRRWTRSPNWSPHHYESAMLFFRVGQCIHGGRYEEFNNGRSSVWRIFG